jgi:hypothetical protein
LLDRRLARSNRFGDNTMSIFVLLYRAVRSFGRFKNVFEQAPRG